MNSHIRSAGSYAFVSLFVAASAVACGSNPSSNSEPTGQAVLTITQAPSDALCASVTASGSQTVTRNFDLKPGQTSVFSMNGLPIGNVVFSANVFGVACSSVNYTSIPDWISDDVPAPISQGTITRITLPMHRNGRASVGLDFPPDDAGTSCTTSGCFVELPIPTPNSGAEYITVGLAGDVYFTEGQANKLGHLDASAAFKEFPLPAGVSGPEAIVTDPKGGVWFGVGQGMLHFDPANAAFSLIPLGAGATHVALSPMDGSIWFSEHSADIVGRLDPQTNAVSEFQVPAGSGPDGLTVAPDGGVWVELEGADTVVRLDPSGKITDSVVLAGDRPGGGCLMIGGDGRVWVSEFSLDAITRISLDAAHEVSPLQLAAGSGPLGVVAVNTNTWFTENGSSKIGWVNANGGLVEIPTPTPNAGPVGIALQPGVATTANTTASGGAVWFVESNANNVAFFKL